MKMHFERMVFWLALIISACVVFASGYLCFLNPENAWRYVLAILIVCVAWLVRSLTRGDRDANAQSAGTQSKVTRAIISSGVLLMVALAGALMARL